MMDFFRNSGGTKLPRAGMAWLLCLCLLLSCGINAGAAAISQEAEEPLYAADISRQLTLRENKGFPYYDMLFDGNIRTVLTGAGGSSLTMESDGGIGSCYLIFDEPYGPYTLTDPETGKTLTFGENRFLHAFVDVEGAFGYVPKAVTLTLGEETAYLCELTVFAPGPVPAYVQQWEEAETGKTDLVLFSTHGDDEQLFFAGLIPYYAGELGYEVQVAYMTDHHNYGRTRRHEMLNGLWAVGLKNYPAFGGFGDYYSTTKDGAYALHEHMGDSRESMEAFVVEQLRRYRPLVAVGHDMIGGEYGHGEHMMYADLLCRGLDMAADPEQYPELAERWGTWEVPKTYLHLWPEGQIRMDWDVPLEAFEGLTAFQVSTQLGFACHKSQYQNFLWYFVGKEKAADITDYSPCEYGLYRTLVGEDRTGKDLFENLIPYGLSPQAQEKQ